MRWRRRVPGPAGLAIAAAIGAMAVMVVAAAGWLWLRARPDDKPPAAVLTSLTLDGPAQIAAAEPFTVTVNASPPLSGTEVLLAAQATGGLYAVSQVLRDGTAQFVLPPGWSQSAGVATLQAAAGGLEASRAITIQPGLPANPLFTLTGPTSVPVDGAQMPLLVAIPLDTFGNPVSEDTPVLVRWQPPAAGARELPPQVLQVQPRDLVAAARLVANSAAGMLTAAASSGLAHSLAQSVRLTPAKVERVEVSAVPAEAPADGAVRVALATGVLADPAGNVLPDGIGVFFAAESSDGTQRWLPAVTVSGRASTNLVAPLAASTLRVRAIVGLKASDPVTLTFTAPQPPGSFDLAVTVQPGSVTLRAGPLLTSIGALAPDGTLVAFTLTDPFGHTTVRVAPTRYGYAEEKLYAGSLPPGPYHVAVQAGEASGQAAFRMPEAQP